MSGGTTKKNLQEALSTMFSQGDSAAPKLHLAELKRLLPYLRGRWKRFLVAFTLLIIISLTSLPIPYLMKVVVDDVFLGDRDLNLFALLLLIMTSLHIGRAILSFITEYLFVTINQTVLADVKRDLFAQILRLPFSFFNKSQSGYLLSRMGEVSGLSVIFSSALVTQLIGFAEFVFSLVVLFHLNWQLTLIALSILPIFFVVVKYSSRGIASTSHRLFESAAGVSSHMEESLSGIEVIKSFGTEGQTTERLTQRLSTFLQKSIHQSVLFSMFAQSISLITALGGLLILGIAGHYILAGAFTIGGYFAFAGYLGRLHAPIISFATFNLSIQPTLVALSRILEFFQLATEHEGRGSKTLKSIQERIEFNHVSFSYDGSDKAVDNVSFTIRSGQKVAIVGPNGAGKSTLVQLLLGLRVPQEGSIVIDGQDIHGVKLSSLRDKIGIVSQNIFLFNDTVKNNIMYSNPNISEQEIEKVIRDLEITDFIENLPQGLDTIIGERGIKLSGGQKQLLAFIRATLKKPAVLLLDEATAAIDQATEERIEKIVKSQYQQNMVIIIAHKSRLIEVADTKIILDKGKIVRIEERNAV